MHPISGSAEEKESPPSARLLISAMTRIPAVTPMDGATGAFFKEFLSHISDQANPTCEHTVSSVSQRRKLLQEASCAADEGRVG